MKRIGKCWLGRVQFAVTRDIDKAQGRYPWAVSFVHIKSGTWCFESKRDAENYRAQRVNDPIPGPGKGPK
jgi:hypothetical protein